MNLKTQWYACLGRQKANKNICRSQRYYREEFLHLLYSSLGVVEGDLVGFVRGIFMDSPNTLRDSLYECFDALRKGSHFDVSMRRKRTWIGKSIHLLKST
jgi:hypothetical protein